MVLLLYSLLYPVFRRLGRVVYSPGEGREGSVRYGVLVVREYRRPIGKFTYYVYYPCLSLEAFFRGGKFVTGDGPDHYFFDRR